MSLLKIKTVIDTANPAELAAAQTFLAALAGDTPVVQEEKPKATRTRAPKKTTEPEPQAEQEETTEDKSPDIDDVRGLLGPKLKADDTNKAKVKAKLTELGAMNVSTLAPEKYEEFITFLNTLS